MLKRCPTASQDLALTPAPHATRSECSPLTDLIVQHGPIGLVATRYRLIEKCSPRFAEMFGYPREELEGKSLALLYPSTKEFIDIGNFGWGQMREPSTTVTTAS